MKCSARSSRSSASGSRRQDERSFLHCSTWNMNHALSFDVIIIGGGHAGAEAARVCARGGVRTAMVTVQREAIGRMSCNPAIGGLAQWQLVQGTAVPGG